MKFFEAVKEIEGESKTQSPHVILAAAIYWGCNAVAQAIYSLGDSNENAARIVSSSIDNR